MDKAIKTAIQQGCGLFYTGAMGEFDSLFSSAVRRAKKDHPHIKLICVKPYMTNDVNTNRDYYAAMYDDVIIPDELAGIHYNIGYFFEPIILKNLLLFSGYSNNYILIEYGAYNAYNCLHRTQ